MNTNNSIFKTHELESRYFELYESILAKWNVPIEPLEITTQFGITHINASGSRSSPALILLPGFGANSTMWFPNVEALTSHFRIYAIDTNGQPGRSIPQQKLTAENSAEWISEILDSLGLAKVVIAGISLGGWLALNFEIQEPERVDRVILLDPASSFTKMSPAFLWHSLLPIMIHPTRFGLIKYFRWVTQGYPVDPDWGELMISGILSVRPQPPIRPNVFTDTELRSAKAPILLLIGERSIIYNPNMAYQRAVRFLPNVQAEIIPGTGKQ